jgi:hypothetical protein
MPNLLRRKRHVPDVSIGSSTSADRRSVAALGPCCEHGPIVRGNRPLGGVEPCDCGVAADPSALVEHEGVARCDLLPYRQRQLPRAGRSPLGSRRPDAVGFDRSRAPVRQPARGRTYRGGPSSRGSGTARTARCPRAWFDPLPP